LGQLILNKGRWNNKQVVDSNYIKEATTPATWLQYTPKSRQNESVSVKPVPCTFYGYQFWIVNYQGLKITYFRGILGQYIFVIPELDAVIVRLGKTREKDYNFQQNYPKDLEIWLKAGIEEINSSPYIPEKD
jgi:CubicO group peptidase (beta-lactamase class C family)